MNIIIVVLVFCIVLFFYLHIYFHLKTSDDLEVYEIDLPSKDLLEEVQCSDRHRFLKMLFLIFNYNAGLLLKIPRTQTADHVIQRLLCNCQ